MAGLRLSAAVIIEDQEGRVLLVRQNPNRGGQWGPPAGHSEKDDFRESALSTARREAREETGFDVLLEFDIRLDDGTFQLGPARTLGIFRKRDSWGFVFAGTLVGEKRYPLEPDIVDVAWFGEGRIHDLFKHGQLYRPWINLPFLVKELTDEESEFVRSENHCRGIVLFINPRTRPR